MFESRRRLDSHVQKAYLARLGVDAEPPSADSLTRLVRRHVERIPYETFWIHAGEKWNTDPAQAAQRIAFHGRGGYCYHLNGAFGSLLTSLGFTVRGHVGGVHGPEGPNETVMGNHLALTVSGLATSANPDGVWYVDVGLGDALYDPLPLTPGVHEQPPFRLSLERAGDGTGWHLTHDPTGGFQGMAWMAATARTAEFDTQHEWLSTSQDSGFVRVATAQRRDATGVDIVRGLIPLRIGEGSFNGDPITSRTGWFDMLADRFGLLFDRSTADARDLLWENVLTAHRQWAGRFNES